MPTQVEFKVYDSSFKESCLKIFDSNVPQFFAAHERISYSQFLDEVEPNTYWIMNIKDYQIGCGGIAQDTPGVFSLCYGLIDQSHHRKGFGRALIKFRLIKILEKPSAKKIRLETMQTNPGFFEKFGFKINDHLTNFYAPGIDKVEMSLHLINPQHRLDLIRSLSS